MSKTKGNPKDAETLQSYLVEKVAGSNRKKKECVCLWCHWMFCIIRIITIEILILYIFEDGL